MSISRCSMNAGNTTSFPTPEDLGFLDFSTFQVVLVVKNPPANYKRHSFKPWVGQISWRRNWQPTPVFLPGESHGQRSLAGYSPQGRKESDMTKYACTTTGIKLEFVFCCFDRAVTTSKPCHDVQTLPRHPNSATDHQPYLPRIWQVARQPPCLTPNSWDPVSVSWGPKFSTEPCSAWKELEQCICNLDHFSASQRERRFSKSQKIRLSMQELHQSIHPLKTIAHVRNKISVCDVKIW